MSEITAELDIAAKPVIFISYSHLDEPNPALPGADMWLSYVQSFLQPAMKYSVFDLWTDEDIPGGTKWKEQIKDKLAACDICILLVSRHSLNSPYCMDIEIETMRERQKVQEDVHIFPIMLSPVPNTALMPLEDLNVRPKNRMPLLGLDQYQRDLAMSAITDEIAGIAVQIAKKKTPKKVEVLGGTGKTRFADATTAKGKVRVVDVTHLPETAYEKLQGRDKELKRLDNAWADRTTNMLSLIAEGGAGKSALVNEWLKRMQADNYRGAETVLGWSFYSQGTKERATSAEQFLNWAIDGLGIEIQTTSVTAKGEAIAEALVQRRVLLVLDGCEPLQHGLDKQQGELKDQGLRALLRRFATMPPSETQGLVILTSRLPVKDIARWKESAAPVVSVEKLSDEAGAALLRDNGVWGTDKELRKAAHDFDGHPLALGLLASFLKETQFGDARRRDHIRAFFADTENPRHDHAKRVMESYEREWLAGEPVLLAIMHLVGLFDRPASDDCLRALRKKPTIRGLTGHLVALNENEWRRAIARLREVRLLAPTDFAAPAALDAHPLVREWFGERLLLTDCDAWRAAHSRLYDHLRRTTREGEHPTLESLAPLYQAIGHGCRAGRYQEALKNIYQARVCRWGPTGELEFYASRKFGSYGTELAALSWFFEKPYETPVSALHDGERSWVLGVAAVTLSIQGRFDEALPALREAMSLEEKEKNWPNAAGDASNLSDAELALGKVSTAVATAEKAVSYADRADGEFLKIAVRTTYADAIYAAGRFEDAERVFAEAERRQRVFQPEYPLLYSVQGYRYCDLLLAKGKFENVHGRTIQTIEWDNKHGSLLSRAVAKLTIARVHLGLVLSRPKLPSGKERASVGVARVEFDQLIHDLRISGSLIYVPLGLLTRVAYYRAIGDWNSAIQDLDEIEDIAAPSRMKLYLCDAALERARLAFATIEAFAPLKGLTDDSVLKPVGPDAADPTGLKEKGAKQLAVAADYIKTCGYHRRDEELAELQAVLRGERKFADLPPRV